MSFAASRADGGRSRGDAEGRLGLAVIRPAIGKRAVASALPGYCAAKRRAVSPPGASRTNFPRPLDLSSPVPGLSTYRH
jgi:hypothetical protein